MLKRNLASCHRSRCAKSYTAKSLGGFLLKGATTSHMYDLVGNTGYSRVGNDADQHEYDIPQVVGAKKVVPVSARFFKSIFSMFS